MRNDKFATPENFNAEGLKVWAARNRPLALAYCAAKVFAEMERERVAAYTLPIFERYTFTCEETGDRITDPNHLYMTGDDQDDLCAEFHAEVCAADIANGWAGRKDCCPALTAETAQNDAERELLNSYGAFAGVGDKLNRYSVRERALEMALEICLSTLV